MNKPSATSTKFDWIKPMAAQLSWKDYWGTFLVRLNIKRMRYQVTPGLYCINEPNASSPVLVTANYKLSFDHLRGALNNQPAWVLVLDTKGINVWCAAGKGTFGTEELVRQIKETKLDQVVKHRQLILPQLGAPGVAAHLVKALSGFKVIYGPVRAKELSLFIQNNYQASPAMRAVSFTFWERAQLVPVEVVLVLKAVLPIGILLFLGSGINGWAYDWHLWLSKGFDWIVILSITLISGAVLTPLWLPYIPGRAFSLKGAIMGGIIVLLGSLFGYQALNLGLFGMIGAGWLIISGSSFLAMNFTGASTYTSLSGVIKEMKLAVPWQKAGIILAAVSWILSLWLDRI